MDSKERPILFSAPMVRAVLAGTKTQTRRAVKFNLSGRVVPLSNQWSIDHPGVTNVSPYGEPGDRLWVRETWRQAYPKTDYSQGVVYRADAPRALGMDEYSDRHKWRPSIHMPRRASRITLEVTGVRVERLQDICEADAAAEGIIQYEDELGYGTGYPDTDQNIAETASGAFRKLWESINGPGSWGANPWVWVVDFKKGDL